VKETLKEKMPEMQAAMDKADDGNFEDFSEHCSGREGILIWGDISPSLQRMVVPVPSLERSIWQGLAKELSDQNCMYYRQGDYAISGSLQSVIHTLSMTTQQVSKEKLLARWKSMVRNQDAEFPYLKTVVDVLLGMAPDDTFVPHVSVGCVMLHLAPSVQPLRDGGVTVVPSLHLPMQKSVLSLLSAYRAQKGGVLCTLNAGYSPYNLALAKMYAANDPERLIEWLVSLDVTSLQEAARHPDLNISNDQLCITLNNSSIEVVPGLYEKVIGGMMPGMSQVASNMDSRNNQSAIAGTVLRHLKKQGAFSLAGYYFISEAARENRAPELNFVQLVKAVPMMGVTGSLEAPFGLGSIGGIARVGQSSQGGVYFIDRGFNHEAVGGIDEEDLTW
jgi:hypothetical protein